MTHLQSYSGSSYDRWVERSSNNSAFGKVQKQYWITKSAVIRKLGKKEDKHVVASDAELDAKIELFKAIESSTKNLQNLLAEYQNKICIMAQEENALGRLLKEHGKQERSRAGKMMVAVGKSLSYTAQQRVSLRNPLVRLYQEVDTFHTRAVEDTSRTVTEMEKIRTEYRGALMWMKNVSQDFNPDQYHQLERFREVQSTVKNKKASFDQMKLKSLQKIDLLAASRCNMFSHALIVYQNNLITFAEKTSKTLNNVVLNFKGYQPYEFQVIKELAEPLPAEEAKEELKEEDLDVEDKDENTFFNAEYHDNPCAKKVSRDQSANRVNQQQHEQQQTQQQQQQELDPKKSDSLMNLFEDANGRGIDTLITLDQTVCSTDKMQEMVDLLTSNPEVPDSQKDTQQMLQELFNSPMREPLPVFGVGSHTDFGESVGTQESISASSAIFGAFEQSDQQQPSSGQTKNMFLPSQLLDLGLTGWDVPLGGNAAPLLAQTANQPSPTAGATNAAGASMGTKPKPSTQQDIKKEVNKLDWYRVFQDIDPLADPAASLLGMSGAPDKKC
ncbi:islet cell autoantigen 1-like protein isoform X2 [Oratosquilla oratoria]